MVDLRIAVIPTRVKASHMKSNGEVVYEWKTVIVRKIQQRDQQGNWHTIPEVEMPLDDAEEQEELARMRKP
ncbi:mechanosensitive ion channel protein MscS [Novimethylophilus kurashikiensis]|uniref:Mechanosensitive ion channel protein MscS n=1 Tax=Novimethylophilus kurashikiensis TaxID=1825523 RepID=A0A2R5FEB5_9PROT|nr:hypothetical protein [Novimethylophilus kurashikiensis]GBG14881.1 mechanosensitive ion channel protein MscS [Novimethylophilus kurashikiensis]